ncbi:hypothetical protein [Nevskia soli]|uniref:hypothetical protein n=1 Tax=Nevskia soli TaxID=418856 RepID=UPI0015D7CD4F|nr:hypothetical protein [Nevskia soli]
MRRLARGSYIPERSEWPDLRWHSERIAGLLIDGSTKEARDSAGALGRPRGRPSLSVGLGANHFVFTVSCATIE